MADNPTPTEALEAQRPGPDSPPASPDDPQKSKYENSLRREPYAPASCTVTLTLQLLPEDGDAAGRHVLIGVQDHAFAPTMRLVRLGELALPPLVVQLLDEHLEHMGEREQAYRQEVERLQKAAMVAKRSTPPSKTGKTHKPVKLADLPAPTPPVASAASVPMPKDKPQQSVLF